MAKIQYSALVNRMGGRISHGVVSNRNVLRRHNARPHQPHSEAQANARGYFSNLKGQWYSLQDVEKELWNSWAAMSPDPMSGLNAFVEHNMRLHMADHADLTAITSPAPTPSTPQYIQGQEILRIAPTTMRYQWTGPDDTSTWVQLYWAQAPGYDIRTKQKFRHLQTTRSDDTYIEWTNDYPLETPIHVKARTIDAFGRVSPWTNILTWEHGVPAPIGTGCVLYLPLDEGAGTRTYDQSGHGNHGVINGPTWTTGKYKYALSFDGLDDTVNSGHNTSLQFPNSFTLEAWVYNRQDQIADFCRLLWKAAWPGNFEAVIYADSDLGIGVWDVPQNNYAYRRNNAITFRQWTFIAAGYNKATGNLFLSVNGDLTTKNIGDITPLYTSTANFLISQASKTIYGLVDQVRAHNLPLSQNQLYDHFSRLQ